MKNKFPKNWNEKRVKAVIAHYEKQTEDESAKEDRGVTEELIIDYHRKGYSISRIAENIDVPIAKVMDVLSRLNEESDIEKTLEEIELSSSD